MKWLPQGYEFSLYREKEPGGEYRWHWRSSAMGIPEHETEFRFRTEREARGDVRRWLRCEALRLAVMVRGGDGSRNHFRVKDSKGGCFCGAHGAEGKPAACAPLCKRCAEIGCKIMEQYMPDFKAQLSDAIMRLNLGMKGDR